MEHERHSDLPMSMFFFDVSRPRDGFAEGTGSVRVHPDALRIGVGYRTQRSSRASTYSEGWIVGNLTSYVSLDQV